jgi:quercetin dioxygenase-like cupin family protein
MTLPTVIAEYKPGAFTPPHRHGNAFVMVYILEGAIVSKVDDGQETVFHAGDHFTEAPGAHHVVFRHALGFGTICKRH